MKKWQKVQQTTEYFVDGIALVLATLITYLVFGKGLHRILLYTADEWALPPPLIWPNGSG